jgi:cytochrome P450
VTTPRVHVVGPLAYNGHMATDLTPRSARPRDDSAHTSPTHGWPGRAPNPLRGERSAAGSGPAFLRDGVPWDLARRKEVARASVRAMRRPQPRGLPRPPGPPSLRTLVRLLRGTKGTVLFGGIARDFPGIAHVRLAREHAYVVSDPELVIRLLLTDAKHTNKGRALMQAKSLLGEGLLTSHGALHRRQRALMMPAFHRARIAGYATQMVTAAQAHAEEWEQRLEQGTPELDMAEDMSRLTLGIVGRTLFGADLAGEAAEVRHALTAVLDNFDRAMRPGARLAQLLRARWIRDVDRAIDDLDGVVARLIAEHRRAGDTGDLLSLLLASSDEAGTMSDAQVRDETMTLVLAGHETTAMALTWAWHLLAENPVEAARLRVELDEVLGGRTPSFEDVGRLPRTKAVVAETMRIYPPAWIIGRSIVDDVDEVAGWRIPAGSIVLALPWALHRDARYWQEPLTFRPDRWLDTEGRFDENAPGQPRGAWFPFGFGSRRCIGDQFAWTEATLVLATLARRFAPTMAPGHVVDVHPAVTLRPEGGMPMVLHRRRASSVAAGMPRGAAPPRQPEDARGAAR